MSAPTYFGLGDKSLIMKFFYDTVVAIPGVVAAGVDYQRSYSASATPEKTPGAFINDVIETKQQILANVVKNTLTVGVVAWTRAGDVGGAKENLWAKMNTYANAIKSAIRKDPTLGQQAYKTEITRVETDSGSRYPVGVFIMIFTVVYFSAE